MKYQTLQNSCCAVFKMLGGCSDQYYELGESERHNPIELAKAARIDKKAAKVKSRIRAKRAALTAKQIFTLQLPRLLRENTIRAVFGRYLDVWGRWRPPRPVVCVQRYCAVVLPHLWLAGLGHHHITRITRGG